MEAHDCAKHSQPEGSVTDDADFIELCRIARRLPAERRDQLTDMLVSDQLKELADTLDAALRKFPDDENPFADLEPFDFSALATDLEPLSFSEGSD